MEPGKLSLPGDSQWSECRHNNILYHLATQSRAGEVCFWETTWDLSQISLKRRVETGIFSFTKMAFVCVTDVVGEGKDAPCTCCVAYVGAQEGKVRVECPFGVSKIYNGVIDTTGMQLKLGSCTSLAMATENSNIIVATGFESGHVVLWDQSNWGRPVSQSKLHESPVLGIGLWLELENSTVGTGQSPADGQTGSGVYQGACGSAEDSFVFIFRYSSSQIEILHKIQLRSPGIDDILFRGDGKILAAACWDGSVRLFMRHSGKAATTLRYHSGAATFVELSDTKHPCIVATGSRDKTVAIWEIA